MNRVLTWSCGRRVAKKRVKYVAEAKHHANREFLQEEQEAALKLQSGARGRMGRKRSREKQKQFYLCAVRGDEARREVVMTLMHDELMLFKELPKNVQKRIQSEHATRLLDSKEFEEIMRKLFQRNSGD